MRAAPETFFEFLAESLRTVSERLVDKAATKTPPKVANMLRKAKQSNDELAALLEQVKMKQKEVGALESELMEQLTQMGETCARAGKLLVEMEEKQGRVSYSYKEAEDLYYRALLKVDKAAAMATAKAVEALKKRGDSKTVLKYSVSESILSTLRGWMSTAWAAVRRAFGFYEEAVDDLEAILSREPVSESGGSKSFVRVKFDGALPKDLIRHAEKWDLKFHVGKEQSYIDFPGTIEDLMNAEPNVLDGFGHLVTGKEKMRLKESSEVEEGMAVYRSSVSNVDSVMDALEDMGEKPDRSTAKYLVFKKAGSNKFHVFVRGRKGWYNGYARMGYSPKVHGPMTQSESDAKLSQKLAKGYTVSSVRI